MNNNKYLCLFHCDFDGALAGINIFNITKDPDKNFQYYVTGYQSISKKLEQIKRDTFDILFILDLNLTEEQCISLKDISCKKIVWIDHHSYSYSPNKIFKEHNINCTFIHDETVSASLITNRFIYRQCPDVAKKLFKISNLANVYDMWIKTDPQWNQAYAINDLFMEYKYEKFFNKFKNGYKLDDEDRDTITRIHTERNIYENDSIENHIQINHDYSIAYVLNPKCLYTNHITLVLDHKFYVILKGFNDKTIGYSIRIYDPEFDLTINQINDILIKHIPELIGGGHEKVGGISIPISENEKFLTLINLIFERKITE